MEITELTPARALTVATPPGVALCVAVAGRENLLLGARRELALTLAWDRGSPGAIHMAEVVEHVAEETLGPDAPLLLRSGELWTPLRDGHLERPGDALFARRVFMELSGPLEHVIDARRPGSPRALDPFGPVALELGGAGSILRARIEVWGGGGRLGAQLAGAVAVHRGAPGWEVWTPAPMVVC